MTNRRPICSWCNLIARWEGSQDGVGTQWACDCHKGSFPKGTIIRDIPINSSTTQTVQVITPSLLPITTSESVTIEMG